ncbi:MAG: hypothetical protein V3T88_05520 [Nitrosomonadaceae bacterium]
MTKPRSTKTDHNGGLDYIERKDETMFFNPMDSAVRGRWSDDMKRFLLKHHEDMYIEDIAEVVGKTVKATKDKAERMMCSIKSKPKSEQ